MSAASGLRIRLALKNFDFKHKAEGVRRRPIKPLNQQFVVFADILGSASGIVRQPDIDVRLLGLMPYMADLFNVGDNHHSFHLPDEHLVLAKFHDVVLKQLAHHYPWHAVAFSDSVFAAFPTSTEAARFAAQLMCSLIECRVPARMGIGQGTFAAIRFDRQEATGRNYYAAQFAGSGVVSAYKAESHGGKGLRIFLDPKAGITLSHNSNTSGYTRRLPTPTAGATHELHYAEFQSRYWMNKQARWLRAQARNSPSESVRQHYLDTLAAFERVARGRKPRVSAT